ncbi:LLM class flavin-dependent oxidoreductase [Candidatus Bathyarchaeota archaeon]|nr:LLM class flavin-dependent oxidoreductase [Candidatus Bathyarchaeota archaeon]
MSNLNIDFGLQIEPQFGYTYGMIKESAKAAEEAGFDSIWASDHFLIRPEAVDVNCLECWTTLTAIAQDTEDLRFGPMVASQGYRNPVLMAKMAASLDHISGGRLYYGIGAGWKEVEYKAYDIPFPSAVTRVRQLDDALEIAKRVWTKDKADYQGDYYSVNDCVCMPKPIQDPLPIVVGGMGNMLLRVAAKHAHIINFAWNIDLDTYDERLDVLRRHCKDVGRNYGEIRKSSGLHLKLDGVDPKVDAPYEAYSGKKEWEDKTPEEAAEWIRGYVDLGVDHFVIVFPYSSEPESVKVFMDEVAPNI